MNKLSPFCLKPIVFSVFVLSFCTIFTQKASASLLVVDQQVSGTVSGGADYGNVGNRAGQSFTPTLNSVNAADFPLSVNLGGSTMTLRLDLFGGTGFGGTLLGSSILLTLSNSAPQTKEFVFATPVTLVPGNTYSFGITVVSTANASNTLNVEIIAPASYAGGSYIGTDGAAVPNEDMPFAEGLAPEPDTWMMFLGGIGGLYVIRVFHRTKTTQ